MFSGLIKLFRKLIGQNTGKGNMFGLAPETVSANKELLAKRVPVNKELLAETVSANKLIHYYIFARAFLHKPALNVRRGAGLRSTQDRPDQY